MLVSLVMGAYQKNELWKRCYPSIARQRFPDLEIVYVEDGHGNNEANSFCKQNGVRYFETGRTDDIWRCPSLALNLGVKESKGEITILTCPEIWHVNNCLELLTAPLANRNQYLTIGSGKYCHRINMNISNPDTLIQNPKLQPINAKLPFLMGMRREDYLAIGGYDEDFTGVNFDDNDFVDRMLAYGYKYFETSALIVHLPHGKKKMANWAERHEYNKQLYESRKGTIKRNGVK